MIKQFLIYASLIFIFINNGEKIKANDASDSLYQMARTIGYINPDSAYSILDELIIEAKDSRNKKNEAKYLSTKGRILVNNNCYQEGLEELMKALKISGQANDYSSSFKVELDLLFYYVKIENFDESQKYYKKLINKVSNIDDQKLQALAYITFGNYFSDLSYATEQYNFIDSAILNFNKSLKLSEINKDYNLTSANEISLGICYYDKKEYQNAIYHYKEALKISSEIKDSIAIADIISNIGSVYFDMGEYDNAIENYKKAKEIYKSIKPLGVPVNIYFNLSEAYANNNEFENAYNYHVQGTNIYDSLFFLEKEKIINDLLVKYESEKLEKEVQEKKMKLEDEKNKNKNRKVTIIALIILIAFILVIIFFLIRSNKLKETIFQKEVEIKSQEINKILKDQELKSYASMLEGQDQERQRIGNDLHDRIGGLLSTVKVYFQTLEEKIGRLEENTIAQYNKADELLNDAVNEVRQISHNLSSGVLKNFGLAVALNDLKQTIELTGELKVNLYFSGDKEPLETSIELEIYKIIQELFSNVIRHSRAKKVEIQFNYYANNINIIFEDDGKGFDSSLKMKGLGLMNIEARVAKLNGELNIDSVIGRGSIFIIDIPK